MIVRPGFKVMLRKLRVVESKSCRQIGRETFTAERSKAIENKVYVASIIVSIFGGYVTHSTARRMAPLPRGAISD
jgi:hypothetical protein